MTALLMPKPSNMIITGAESAQLVESDVFNICERILEIDRNLYIITLDHPAHGDYVFAVMERCVDGFDRMVKRYKELDARVIQDLQYFASKPLQQRLREIEINEDKMQAEREEEEFEEFYERVGRPMWSQLDHDGFIAGGRGVSYAKRGIK